MVASNLPATADRLLSREEAAAFLGVKKSTLEAWACTGRGGLPYVRIGRAAKYSLAALQKYVAEHTATHSGAHEAGVAAAS